MSFVANGKTLVTYTEKYGTVIDIPAAPALEGHEFVGWTGSNGNEVAVSSTIKGDFTYYAKYKKLSYNVTWNINGKTAVESYEYGAAINTPTVVAEKGYEFTGRDKTVPLSMPAKALTFTAQFEAKTTPSLSILTAAVQSFQDRLHIQGLVNKSRCRRS